MAALDGDCLTCTEALRHRISTPGNFKVLTSGLPGGTAARDLGAMVLTVVARDRNKPLETVA